MKIHLFFSKKNICVILSLFFILSNIAQDRVSSKKEIAGGLIYEHIFLENPKESIHILSIDPAKRRIRIEHAQDGFVSRETVSSMAKRTNAIAAVNGSNYRRGGPFNGNSVNLSVIDGVVVSDPHHPRGALGWSQNKTHIDYLKTEWKLKIGHISHRVDRINQPHCTGECIVYTDRFFPTTHTGNDVVEFVIENNTITAIHKTGNTLIPKNGFVYTVDKNNEYAIDTIQIGMNVQFSHEHIPYKNPTQKNCDDWKHMDFILGGAGLLVKSGKIAVHSIREEFNNGTPICKMSLFEISSNFHDAQQQTWLIEDRHPRTAVGIKKDGTWIIVLVDGRQPNHSLGFTLQELAEFMLSKGCVDALNIGGGGCSTMFVENDNVNKPSGSSIGIFAPKERPVSEAIIIL